jgi:hypothetical protein
MKSIKHGFIVTLTIIIFLTISKYTTAQDSGSVRTVWKIIDSSLADLLNDGWKLVNQSSDRAAIATGGGIGAFDEQTFTFVLSKNGKYVMCAITNPSVRDGVYSRCRSLN